LQPRKLAPPNDPKTFHNADISHEVIIWLCRTSVGKTYSWRISFGKLYHPPHRYTPSWKLALGTLISAVILNGCAQAKQSSHEEASETPTEVQITASQDVAGPVITTREGDVQGYARENINVF
jgi:hypothetical protein